MFRVNQKVVCVDASCNPDSNTKPNLRDGAIYTIARVYTLWGELGVDLEEAMPNDGYAGFRASRFRPVVERKTDISIFTAMLNPKKQKVRA